MCGGLWRVWGFGKRVISKLENRFSVGTNPSHSSIYISLTQHDTLTGLYLYEIPEEQHIGPATHHPKQCEEKETPVIRFVKVVHPSTTIAVAIVVC